MGPSAPQWIGNQREDFKSVILLGMRFGCRDINLSKEVDEAFGRLIGLCTGKEILQCNAKAQLLERNDSSDDSSVDERPQEWVDLWSDHVEILDRELWTKFTGRDIEDIRAR